MASDINFPYSFSRHNANQLNINTILKKNIDINGTIPISRFTNLITNSSNKLDTSRTNINNINNINTYSNSDISAINRLFNNNNGNTPNTQNIHNTQNAYSSEYNGSAGISANANSNTNKYNIIRYLGEGIQGSLYLATDNKKKRFICKKIMIDDKNPNQNKQLEFELNILKYLSSNSITKDYINPCLEHKIVENQIFTVFPVFDGYSLNHLTGYLKKLNDAEYYKIVFHIIKTILYGLAKIHQSKIAHQNVNDNSILISTYTKPKEINVKFTDFGLGCGNKMRYNEAIGSSGDSGDSGGNMLNIDDYENDAYFKFSSCKANNYTPVKMTDDIIKQLSESEYLLISQKYDLLCLGMLFLKLLCFFENMKFDLSKGYNKKNLETINRILNKYVSKYVSSKDGKDSKDSKDSKDGKDGKDGKDIDNDDEDEIKKDIKKFITIDVKDEVKRDILAYLKILAQYVFCKTADRQTCQYVLDKIIVYEKYKNDIF